MATQRFPLGCRFQICRVYEYTQLYNLLRTNMCRGRIFLELSHPFCHNRIYRHTQANTHTTGTKEIAYFTPHKKKHIFRNVTPCIASCLLLTWLTLRPWRWEYIPSKRRCSTELHGTTSQKTVLSTGSTLDLYSGGARIESQSGHQLSWLSFPGSSTKMPNSISTTPRPLPSKSFPIHQSSYHSTLCSLVTGSVVI
jgi:hypothetical protein